MRAARRLSVNYLVHDVWDAAVARRVSMLVDGGAKVTVAGFRRRDPATPEICGAQVLDLGRTADAALSKRAGLVVWRALTARFWSRRLPPGDVVIARSLELLTLAWAMGVLTGAKRPLVYECLDIHRLMLSDGLVGRVLRRWERFLLARCALVITSSPAFISAYFERMQASTTPFRLVENKPILACGELEAARRPSTSPPWRIGWFGMIRCAKSLDLLCALAAALPGRVEVVIAGRVSENEFADFHGAVASCPAVQFLGPYAPDELAELYGRVHFTWAIDFFEEGLNSAWLLPNRLYEGGAFGAVPLALEGVETGRWLARQGAGVLLPADPSAALAAFFSSLTPDAYKALAATVALIPRKDFIANQSDCDALVDALCNLKTPETVK